MTEELLYHTLHIEEGNKYFWYVKFEEKVGLIVTV
jgi:hypothetical protein